MRRTIVSANPAGGLVPRPPILLTAADQKDLFELLSVSDTDSRITDFLREELNRADVVYEGVSAARLVTMGSEVTFIDHAEASARRVKLVYPADADADCCISVLTGVGSALIGLGPGQSITWNEQGAERRISVLQVR